MAVAEEQVIVPNEPVIPPPLQSSPHEPSLRSRKLLVFLLVGIVGVVVLGAILMKFLQSRVNLDSSIKPETMISTITPQALQSDSVSPTARVVETLVVTPTRAVMATNTPTKKPTTIQPTGTPTSNPTQSSCAYGTGATGAVKVEIKPQSGLVVGDQTVELQALSGCKVLDGSSADKQTMVARAGGNGYSSLNTVTYSSVPSGSYSVRIQYKGQWTGYQNVTVVSGQSKTVEFQVAGETPTPTPTPTPIPKPVCGLVVPNSAGTAPFAATICVGNNSNPYQNISQEYVDYNGDGVWDYQGSSYGCHGYTFTNPGSYTARGKIVNTNGVESDLCSVNITVN